MESIESRIISAYVPYKTSLREVARIVGTNHHRVKRILSANGVTVVRGRRGAFTEEHKKNISQACKGRKPWSMGNKMPKDSLYKNMAAHLRFDVTAEWLSRFEDVEKLKFLNGCISRRGDRYDTSTDWYKEYIERFYSCPQFNRIYEKWLIGKDKYMRPTIDHITPRSNGGCNDINNLQFLTWFENRAKNDLSQNDWDRIKYNIKDYIN